MRYWLALAIIVATVVFGLFLYPQLPDQLPSHWNTQGEVDDYFDRFWGTFLMPGIALLLLAMFIVLPRIDPLKHNVKKFNVYYEWFAVLLVAFLCYIEVLILLWGMGIRYDIRQVFIPAFGVLFIYIGVLIRNSKRNWFVGIKTPWTLSNDKVWEKTHQMGSVVFMIAGVCALFSIFFPDYAMVFVLVPLVLLLVPVIYSYFSYQRIVKKK